MTPSLRHLPLLSSCTQFPGSVSCGCFTPFPELRWRPHPRDRAEQHLCDPLAPGFDLNGQRGRFGALREARLWTRTPRQGQPKAGSEDGAESECGERWPAPWGRRVGEVSRTLVAVLSLSWVIKLSRAQTMSACSQLRTPKPGTVPGTSVGPQ